MVKPTFNNNKLILDIEGADKIWSLKSRLELDIRHITGVRLDSEIVIKWYDKWYDGLKATGTLVPHVITAGTFHLDGKKVFWDIHHPEKVVVISLKDETYNELVIEVENPDIFVDQLQQTIGK